jgi:hypothetical protein
VPVAGAVLAGGARPGGDVAGQGGYRVLRVVQAFRQQLVISRQLLDRRGQTVALPVSVLQQHGKRERVLGPMVATHEIAERDAERRQGPRRGPSSEPSKLGPRALVFAVADSRAHPAEHRDVAADPFVEL